MSGQPIVYETLDKMCISYRKEEHIAVFSAEDKERSGLHIWDGYKVSKNL